MESKNDNCGIDLINASGIPMDDGCPRYRLSSHAERWLREIETSDKHRRPSNHTTTTDEERYRLALVWLRKTMEHLNMLERLGYGVMFRRKQLDHLRCMNDDDTTSHEVRSSVATLLEEWIRFDSKFRAAYNCIAKTYYRLGRKEVHINLLRTNSLHMLEREELGCFSNPLIGSFGDPVSHSELYGKLVSVWYTKLSALRCRNIREFRKYVIDAVAELQCLSVPRALAFVDEMDMQSAFLGRCGMGNEPQGSAETADDGADCNNNEDEDTDDYEPIFEDTVELVNKYYQKRGISEESSLDYVNRVTDLSSRLLPRFLKVGERMPIYSDTFHDSHMNTRYQLPPSLSASSTGVYRSETVTYNKGEGALSRGTTSDNWVNRASPRYIPNKQDGRSSSRSGRDKGYKLPRWTECNSFVSLLSRTNLDVIDAVRCIPSGSSRHRKLVIFTRGGLKDLFLNRSDIHCTENVDMSSIIGNDSVDPTLADGSSSDSDCQSLPPIRKGSQNLMRALLTEDLAGDEIDKVVARWFPPLVWNSPPVVPCSSIGTEDTKTWDNWYPHASATDLTNDTTKIQRDAWLSRLTMFHSLTTRQLQRLLDDRTLVEPGIRYDSSGYATMYDFPPLRAMCDFKNHIPIKYTMKFQSQQGEGHYGWIQSLFGGDLKDVQFEWPTEVECLKLPIASQSSGINAMVVPIDRGAIELSDSYRMIGDICDCLTDYVYPPLYEQHNFRCQRVGPTKRTTDNLQCHLNDDAVGTSDQDSTASSFIDTSQLGKVFISRHSRLCMGSQWSSHGDRREDAVISVVFYLVCCDDYEGDEDPLSNPEDTEHIRQQMERMRSVLDGIDHILLLCEELKVVTLSLPVALRCCFPAEGTKGSESNETSAGIPDPVSNGIYMRCLATATHLSTSLSRGTFPVALNLIFPEILRNTEIEKNTSHIFMNRAGAF